MGLYDALALPLLDLPCVGPIAQEQAYGAENDALSRSSLTGDDGETREEWDVELINEGEILDV